MRTNLLLLKLCVVLRKKLGKEYAEQVNMGRYSIVREFLDALVSSGELTELNRKRIQKNPDLEKFFHQPQVQPKDMDLDASDDSLMISSDRSKKRKKKK